MLGGDAPDLRVNGQAASSGTGAEAGPYVFSFAQPVAGPVQFSWAGTHGITDYASNAFTGASWSVTLNPRLGHADVVITEFVAGNTTGLKDEDGDYPDWIELHNRGSNAVNLLGWALTDDARTPTKWTFPSRVLAPGEYLVVFASGKDRRAPSGTNRFHTNFKLDLYGEYLALYNAEYPPVPVTEFVPKYPEQRNDHSYGLDSTGQWRYFSSPTPGAPNGTSTIVGIASPPHFSVGRGLFNQPFNLLLTTTLPGAIIRYTLDGSAPTLASGYTYTAPIRITNTAFVRAAVFASNYLPSRVITHSYIYLDRVPYQPANPPGFPNHWGTNYGTWVFAPASSVPGFVPADYEMDLDPVRVDPNNPASPIDPEKFQRLMDGLRELPVVSLVMKTEDMFGPSGLYPNSREGAPKPELEKPCSVEMFLPDGSTAFAADCGIDLHGNASRAPQKNPKHGFKLNFRGEYGESKLRYKLFPDSPATEFDDIILRPDFNTSWRHWSDSAGNSAGAFQRTRASRTRDAWIKHTMRDMGHVASHNRYFHLFINGLYWGVYDFSEQVFPQFAENYFGGSPTGYDIYDQGTLKTNAGGTPTAYNAMLAISNLSDNANYERMKQYLDVPQFIDYMLLHFFVGHQDWGNNKNWAALRKRVAGPDGTFKYFPWDGECILLNEDVNRVSNTDVPSGLHTKLRDNAQYRLDFADRVHKHMLAPGGALTRESNIARWNYWMAILDKPIVAESCRWGDYRRDVHQYADGTYQLYTRESHWLAEHYRMTNSYFANRPGIVLTQLRAAGLYPSIEAPEFREKTAAGQLLGSRRAPAGFVVAMRNPNATGTIYYTTNGADPRVYYSGQVSPFALVYTAPLTLTKTVTLKARVLSGTTWSALNEATFTIGELGPPLRITELMYNPPGGNAYEFIELQNVGAVPLNIGRFSFQGISFIFPDNTVLAPGAVIVLANNANPSAFAARYPGVAVFGYYAGNLDNAGERIALLDRDGRTVVAVHYDDESGWPPEADGAGRSLEIINPWDDPNAPANWRASAAPNGTPGLAPVPPPPSDVVLNEIMADNATAVSNAGTYPDWIELHNRSTNAINLGNWSLSDSSNPRKFVFPPGTVIPPNGYLVVWCDNATNLPGHHTGFALAKDGETVSLFDAQTNRIDAVTFGLQLTDYSLGRIGEQWQLTVPTPGAANVAAQTASPTNLVINEWLANAAPGGADWLELFNCSGTAPVALAGLGFGTSNALFRYNALSFVAPKGYVQLFADELPGPDHLEFKLPAEGGFIVLYDHACEQIDRVNYGVQTEGVSQGRLPDGSTNIVSFPGSASPGASNYVLAWQGPVLNELLARNVRAALSPWGNYADYIELFNPAPTNFPLGGLALGKSPDPAERWTIPAGTSIPAGTYLVIWCDGSRPASTSAAGPLNTGFNLPGESGAVYLFNSAGQLVDSIEYGFQVEDMPIGRSTGQWRLLAQATPGTANAAPATLGAVSNLCINEWMAAPASGEDWFELYNRSALPVELSGLYLTDDPSIAGIAKSPVPPLSFIGGRKWVVFIADDNRAAGANHANFKLDRNGESIRLYQGRTNLIDVVDFGLQATGVSQGRLPDGAETIVSFVATPTPGSANYMPMAEIVINEVLTHTDAPLEDAIELYNPSPAPVNIGGWFISDNPSDLKRYRIPDGTVLAPGGFKVFYQYQFGPTNSDDDSPPLFTLNSARGDAVYLSEADAAGNLTGRRAHVEFGAAAHGVSFGRYQTSVGVDFVALSRRTFGMDDPATLEQFRTGTGAPNAYPLVGPVVINEIMYHPRDYGTNVPDAEEFIELLNVTDSPVPLYDPARPTNTWRLTGAVEFRFAPGIVLPARSTLLVVPFDPVANPAAAATFRSRYSTDAPLVGPYSGKLDNAGETIELLRPDAPKAPPHPDAGFVPFVLVERVAYDDEPPWPVEADGSGASLQRIVPTAYGNDPINWRARAPTAGRMNIPPPLGSASLLGAGTLRLSFSVEPGLTCQVQYKDNLSDPDWHPLGPPAPASQPLLIVDVPVTNRPHRFYRLAIFP
ncbi:MAG: lamin tail domain-containing protein [Verrucomicrobiae bacterium]|nr:lamin tail domain-containing protein [Verrucomicrobiae bacterium]